MFTVIIRIPELQLNIQYIHLLWRSGSFDSAKILLSYPCWFYLNSRDWRCFSFKPIFYTFENKYSVFDLITRFVCPSVITFVTKWLDLATWCHVKSIVYNYTRTQKCNTCQNDLFPDPDHMDHPDKITFLACNFISYGRIYTKFSQYVVQLGKHHVCQKF